MLHSILVVRACGAIFERGVAPAILTILLIKIHLLTKTMELEMDITFVFLSGFHFKKGLLSATLIWDVKN